MGSLRGCLFFAFRLRNLRQVSLQHKMPHTGGLRFPQSQTAGHIQKGVQALSLGAPGAGQGVQISFRGGKEQGRRGLFFQHKGQRVIGAGHLQGCPCPVRRGCQPLAAPPGLDFGGLMPVGPAVFPKIVYAGGGFGRTQKLAQPPAGILLAGHHQLSLAFQGIRRGSGQAGGAFAVKFRPQLFPNLIRPAVCEQDSPIVLPRGRYADHALAVLLQQPQARAALGGGRFQKRGQLCG